MSNRPQNLMDIPTMIFFGIMLTVIIVMVISPNEDSFRNQHIPYNEFISQVSIDNVQLVIIKDDVIFGKLNDGSTFKTVQPANDPQLMNDLLYHNVTVEVAEHVEPSMFWSWLPTLLLIGVIIWFFNRQAKSMSGTGGKSKFEVTLPEDLTVTMDDVAGIDEAKADLAEVIDFLKNPEKYQRVGGKMPHGILMTGEPGCGKTLLAKAMAKECGVPFISTDGSAFVEKFVGVGASRVRELFDLANQYEKCIIFIDEIDSVGRDRNAGMSNDEREGTLNQLLVRMDGFDNADGIIIIAATNRPDILDKALMRPGRFDRQVSINLPDINGREKILQVHSRKLLMEDDFDYRTVARGCVGMSGADLANLMNEAALLVTKFDDECVTKKHIELAKDKILMGAERKGFVMTDAEKECTAYHEAGHAIVGMTVPDHDPVHKVSIIPRGRALGVTMYLPDEDRLSYSKQRLLSSLVSLMGGRAAEEIIYGEMNVTTGASNDIERATELATNMVTKWGFSEALGTLNIGGDSRSYKEGRSEMLRSSIESEAHKLVAEAYVSAKKILIEKMPILEGMTAALIEYETLDKNQVIALMDESTK